MARSLSWDDLKYDMQPWIRTAVDSMGFETMTPVQASTIPMFSGNKDVVVESVTGSGKTVAFVIPILEKIVKEVLNGAPLKKGNFYSLVISPTRELASQIQSVIDKFLAYYPDEPCPIQSQLLVGSSSSTVRDDANTFMENKPQVLVGTPGRLLDFLKTKAVKTASCGIIVLDEADKLLDVSFEKDVEAILSMLPKQRRTGLFSATISSAGDQIFRTGMRNPVKIAVKSKVQAPESLKISYVVVKPEDKLQYLLYILNHVRYRKCIVYFPTCISVTYFYSFFKHLFKLGIMNETLEVYSLHGKLQTSSRLGTLEKFSVSLNNSVLLTTDVAARGIDIPEVDLVLQLDPPTSAEMFLHRCGRTGRANRAGKAITFLNRGREEDYVNFLEVKNIDLEEMKLKFNPSDEFSSIFKEWILADRARFENSVRAYVGFIRYYSKHSASSIFRLQSLDYVGIAKLYGLIRLPRMPEITQHLDNDEMPQDGWLIEPAVDLDSFSFVNPQMESSRLEELKKTKAIKDKNKLKSELKKKNAAWSNKTSSKESKGERKVKSAQRRKAIEEKIAQEESDDESEAEEDWKDMVRRNKKQKTSSQLQGNFSDL
ncbi:LANO_0B02036g1_1 [Lachancea nothofagi CBS 11611]|uniref:ATP-dependent RNA helicase n=1 Tax=Lachancea nothofagi CBS 11611 TaxID=1266666 RepID=A0A1G4IW38_9SACH|nr:LANO_0B02036g1_1 [Lachancea nothofagi CBS 11611]